MIEERETARADYMSHLAGQEKEKDKGIAIQKTEEIPIIF